MTVFVFGGVVGGLCVWLVGRSHAVYAGASGVVFTFWGYILALPCFESEFHCLSFVVAIGVGAVYSSLLWGMLPSLKLSNHKNEEEVAWEAHFFGYPRILYMCTVHELVVNEN